MRKLVLLAVLVAAALAASSASPKNRITIPDIPTPLPPATCHSGSFYFSACTVERGTILVVYGDFANPPPDDIKAGCLGWYGKRPHQNCETIWSRVLVDDHTLVALINPGFCGDRLGTRPFVVTGQGGGQQAGDITIVAAPGDDPACQKKKRHHR